MKAWQRRRLMAAGGITYRGTVAAVEPGPGILFAQSAFDVTSGLTRPSGLIGPR
jgi:hypothetical protein